MLQFAEEMATASCSCGALLNIFEEASGSPLSESALRELLAQAHIR